jgi:hypothetical protein
MARFHKRVKGASGQSVRAPLDAMLAEYNTLRQESLQSIGNRVMIMNFTFGALAIVLAGLITRRSADIVTTVIALFFVPQLAKASLLIWLGEYNRSQRAGRWVADLEARINRLVETPDAMGWEGHLAEQSAQSGGHMGYPYAATVFIVLGGGYAASLVGLYFLYLQMEGGQSREIWVPFSLASAWVIVIESIFLRFFLRRWKTVRENPPEEGGKHA